MPERRCTPCAKACSLGSHAALRHPTPHLCLKLATLPSTPLQSLTSPCILPCGPPAAAQHVCKLACSEEVPEPVDMGGEGFCVAFDPLDGSSIVDTNFSVGTIFGVWPGDKLTGITGAEQVGWEFGGAASCTKGASYPRPEVERWRR
jgi:hypothetical protein